MNIAENRDRLRHHLIYFHQSLEYYKQAYPDKGIGQYADLYLDNEMLMEEGMKAHFEALREIEKYNQRILKAIKSVKGKTFFKHLVEYLKNQEATDYQTWEIVSKPIGTLQEVDEYGRAIKKEWVDQRSNGDSGDSWSGSICIQLKENRFLKFYFSM